MAIPELGVRLPGLPAGVASPEVKARIDGYTTTLQIGTATLTIDRMEETLPLGSDIRNAKFRATQQAGFEETRFSNAGHPTTIDGHDAWTTTIADRSPKEGVYFSSRTYVIVDQHLYRFLAYGWWNRSTPPPDFVAAAQACADVRFVSVDRSLTPGTHPASGLVKMPYFFPTSTDYYPDTSRRRGETGIVDLEFSIDGKGRARDLQETYAATRDLGVGARLLLSDTHFFMPPAWEDKGYQKLRFTFEVHFALAPRGGRCEQVPTRVPDAELVLICGSALLGR